RSAIKSEIWEFPGGTIERGESPLQAAARELEEEAGYRSTSLELAREFFTAPHFSDEKVFLFLARSLSKGTQRLQDKEFLTVHRASCHDLWEKHKFNEI